MALTRRLVADCSCVGQGQLRTQWRRHWCALRPQQSTELDLARVFAATICRALNQCCSMAVVRKPRVRRIVTEQEVQLPICPFSARALLLRQRRQEQIAPLVPSPSDTHNTECAG